MGAWGTAIFSDDIACDLRDEFKDQLGDGYSPEEATMGLLKKWEGSLSDPNESPVIWLALAVTQWKLGHLSERVAREAIHVIDSEADLSRWDQSDRNKRRKTLEKVRQQLLSPQPPARKVKKRFRNTCDWEAGELISYETLSKGKILFRVVRFHEDRGGKSPVCELLKWMGKSDDQLPPRWRLRLSGIRKSGRVSQFMLGRTSERELPKDRVKRTGLKMKPSRQIGNIACFPWSYLDQLLKEKFGIE